MHELNSDNDTPCRILFVDDEPAVLHGIARSLHSVRKQWEVDMAGSAEEALALVRRHAYQVVVSDMCMPGASGADLLQQIQAISPDCVRLMLTGHADVTTALAAVNQGYVFQLLVKPCPGVQLIHSLELALRQYELQTVERTLLRSQLEHAQRMAVIGQFTAGIVHDVNNLLAGITGLSGTEIFVEREEAMRMIHESGNRAVELTRELMAFSRRDEDRPLQSVDLGAVVQSCANLIRPIFGPGILLEAQVSADLLPVWGHAGKLKQIITNLLMNARDVTPADGTILVSAGNRPADPEKARVAPDQRGDPMVCLAVTDHGCGMDEATRNRLFEPFFTTKAAGKGTGLGLSLVRQLVDQHRGWIEVESAPGAGSTFRVFLCAAATGNTGQPPAQ